MKLPIVFPSRCFGIAALWFLVAAAPSSAATISVPGLANIALAGQPSGIALQESCSSADTVTLNAPILVPLGLAGGNAIQISASGTVNTDGGAPQTQPNGVVGSNYDSSNRLGLSSVRGPRGSLVGVFLGPAVPSVDARPPGLDFSGAARNVLRVEPAIRQVFFIGTGVTSDGTPKSYIVPAGATRLFLGVLDRGGCNGNNTGSFSATVAQVPPPAISGNPRTVYGIANIGLAGQPAGSFLSQTCSWIDSAPLNAPPAVDVALVPGRAVQFNVSGTVDTGGGTPQISPNGVIGSNYETPTTFGLSSLAGPRGALVGVFLGPGAPNPDLRPRSLDFTGGARSLPAVEPVLQQVFYIGSGRTPEDIPKRFIIPPGATRLFLGVLDRGGCNSDNTGEFAVTTAVVDPPSPPPPGEAAVFGIANIAVAGQPTGAALSQTCSWPDSVPLNAPPLMNVPLVPGRAVRFTVVGAVDTGGGTPLTQPNGVVGSNYETSSSFGLSSVAGPRGALVGVFLGPGAPNPSARPAHLEFTGAARAVPIVAPMLQQVFYIGSGRTPDDALKSFIIPDGASRLFLGVLDRGGCNSDNTGSFAVTATVGDPPPPPPPAAAAVFGIANITLAGRPAGAFVSQTCSWADSAPLNAPPAMSIDLVAGATLQFAASGLVDTGGGSPQTSPNGVVGSNYSTAAQFGLSSVTGPRGALVGVFLDDRTPTAGDIAPPALNFSSVDARDLPAIAPLLRQVFFIGSGVTSAGASKDYVVPHGTTRLFLGVLDRGGCNGDNTGSFTVVASGAGIPPPPSPTSTRTATRTPTSTAPWTATATATASRTHTPTPTFSPSPTPTRTATRTPTATPSGTPTSTSSRTATFTPSASATRTPTATASSTPTWSPSPTTTRTATATASPNPTSSPTASATPTPTSTTSPTATASHTVSPAPTHTPTAPITPGASETATLTSTPVHSPTAIASPTDSPAPTATPPATPTPTASATPSAPHTPTATPTASPTDSVMATPSTTVTSSPTASPTSSLSPEPTAAATPSASPSPTSSPAPNPTDPPAACAGDCNGDGRVTVDEIVRAVAIALGNVTASECPAADGNGDGQVTVDELVRAVAMALGGCSS